MSCKRSREQRRRKFSEGKRCAREVLHVLNFRAVFEFVGALQELELLGENVDLGADFVEQSSELSESVLREWGLFMALFDDALKFLHFGDEFLSVGVRVESFVYDVDLISWSFSVGVWVN